MQFKNPEILYFFALLIIPILVHLFQLQKFVKIPFTNVAFLQKLQQQTRKSSRIKKWLILATRLLLFSAILLAFSQPYFSDKNIDKKQHTFIYLDNSLSTNTKGEKGNLLKIASQEIIESSNEKDVYSLQTNTNFYKDISKNELKNLLLKVENTSKKIDLSTVFLKIDQQNKSNTNTLHKNILISDFQDTYKNKFTNVTPSFSAIKLESSLKSNLSIDSVFVGNANTTNFTVNAIIKNQGEEKNNTPISIFNNENLVSKQSFSIDKDASKTIQFTIQNQDTFLGKIQLIFSDTFQFDNTYFFSINKRKKASVLAIGNEADFLSKIYTEDEFNFSNSTIQNVNYNAIPKQQLIILNSLENIPEILAQSLFDFSKNGGSLVIIPNEKSEVNSYNSFFNKMQIGQFQNKIIDTLKITSINYNHPLFKNVFSKKVNNFQYPSVYSLYPISSKNNNTIISFENNTPFISELKNNIYYVSSSLAKTNSNFLNSPLIVPVFYNFGQLSFQFPQLSYRVDTENKIGIETQLGKDEILTIANNQNSFIPLQQTFQNNVVITTKEQPLEAGIHAILKQKDTLQNIAFNFPKEESSLQYLDLNTLAENNKNIEISSSIPATFDALNKKNEVQWLWKWFLALAIVSLLLEILILKFYKP
ncbi:BatA domain-containing protein [Polaribacter haliotis]|uniref:BatA domain-containing protein n=1 Tax=Polaribacter haliotis TaxID=1888915 RepID=A0A7L8AI17_9FLAO|nr:BatA domain-containing protein [Polaribacter haliotis]QOD61655.1 BatA domain-containing protein [Polaribacter haliotis]